MIKVFDETLTNNIEIIYANIDDNILNIYYYHNDFEEDNYIEYCDIFELFLKQINLINGKISDIYLFSGDIDIIDFNIVKIFKNKLYLFIRDILYIYKINIFDKNYKDGEYLDKTIDTLSNKISKCLLVNNKNYKNITLLNKFKINIKNIIIYNDIIYFLMYDNDKYSFIDNNNNILFEFSDICSEYNTVIKLNVEVYCCILKCYKDYIIFYDICDEYVFIYNIKTGETIEFENYITILSDDKFIYQHNNEKYIYDIEVNKSYISDEFFNGKIPSLNYDGIILEINNYYLTFMDKTHELTLYMNDKVNFIHQNGENFSLCNLINDNLVKIGTDEKHVYLPIKYLLDNSELINGMYSNIDNITEIIHSSFEYIIFAKQNCASNCQHNLYYDFIKGDKVDDLYNLFKICGLLIDKNLEIVGEIIIENIKYNDVNIDESLKYLEIFSTNIHHYLFEKLFYIIMNKYNINDIKYKFNKIDKNTKLYNFCITEMINFICLK